MRKLICLLVIVLLLCSCQSNIIDEEESPLKKSTMFSFVKMDCITDAYGNHGWASVAIWIESAFIPQTAAVVAIACTARNAY